ncbi:MAG: DUF456 family protein [Thermodesulfobacteriota bacterium]
MDIVTIIAIAVLILFCLAGLVLTPLGMPGNFVILAGALVYDLIVWDMAIGVWRLVVLLGLAVVGEVLEYILSMAAARKRGASNKALFGAIVGGIVGAVIGTPVPVVGSIIGLFLGVFLGAFLLELVARGDAGQAYHAAVGAFYGRVGAIVAKTMVGVAIIGVIFMGLL